jgi:diguanylate cyclase (GGDEF)-like protein
MLDMDRHLRPVRRAVFAVLGVALIACGPQLGWWTLLPLAMAVIVFRVADARMDRAKRPEYALLASWVGSQIIMASSVALSGGPHVPTMAWFAIPLMTLGARFSGRGIAVGVAVSILLLLAVGFGVDARAVIDNPTLVVAPIALMITVAMFQTVLMRSDLKHRAEAVIDPLTGMLNRNALARRAEELAQQSLVARQPIGLIAGDIDHFKAINDTMGHLAGDLTLRELAGRLRGEICKDDLLARYGGEEFAAVLTEADKTTAADLAEQLRRTVEGHTFTFEGRRYPVTISLGVASIQGDELPPQELIRRSDERLYRAKREGRNRVIA